MSDTAQKLSRFDRDLQMETAIFNLWSVSTATEALLLKIHERDRCEMHNDEDYQALAFLFNQMRKSAVAGYTAYMADIDASPKKDEAS